MNPHGTGQGKAAQPRAQAHLTAYGHAGTAAALAILLFYAIWHYCPS